MSPLQRALLCVLTMPDASISKGHCCRKWYDICSRQACCTWHTSIVQHKPTSLLRLRPFPMKGASALVSNWSERLASRAGMLLHASHASHASGQSGQQASTLSASTAHRPCITGHWCAWSLHDSAAPRLAASCMPQHDLWRHLIRGVVHDTRAVHKHSKGTAFDYLLQSVCRLTVLACLGAMQSQLAVMAIHSGLAISFL